MSRVCQLLSQLATHKPRSVITVALLLAVLCALFAAQNLQLDTNQDNLIGKDQNYYQEYIQFLKEFGDWESVYIVVKNQALTTNDFQEQAKVFARELNTELKKHPQLFQTVFINHDTRWMTDKLFLLGEDTEFQNTLNGLNENQKHLQRFLSVKTVSQWHGFLAQILNDQDKHQQLSDLGTVFQDSLNAPYDKEALENLQKTQLTALLMKNRFDADGFMFSGDQNHMLIQVLPHKDYNRMDIIQKPLTTLRGITKQLLEQKPGITVGITGRPVLQNDEALSTQSDSEWAGILSFVSVAALFFWFFKSYRRSLFALASLTIGICWTLGVITAVYGSLNLLTIVFAIILIGLGIDYSIHYLLSYTASSDNQPQLQAIRSTYKTTVPAILLGALTSATAFGTAIFTDFLGLQQLGVIVATGIVLCALSQLLVFPSLLRLWDQNSKTSPWPQFPILQKIHQHPKKILVTVFLLTLACIPIAWHTQMEHNLLALQDPELESVVYEKILQKEWPTWFLTYQTTSLDDLKNKDQLVNSLPTVLRTESILDAIPSNQDKRRQKLNRLGQNITPLPQPSSVNGTQDLLQRLEELLNLSFSAGHIEEYTEIQRIQTRLNQQAQKTPLYQKEFLALMKNWQQQLMTLFRPHPITPDTIPAATRSRFISPNGVYSLTIYPKNDVWDPQAMEDFIVSVRQHIPNVTGAPITTYESAQRLESGFVLVGLLTSLIVIVTLMLSLKSLKTPLILYTSLVTCFIWLLALMKGFGISINLANFFALPVLIGSGIDHGLHVFYALKAHKDNSHLYSTTLPAIFLSCATTLCGFSTLAFVRHQGLASFGVIMALGTFLILVMSLVVLPVASQKKTLPRKTPDRVNKSKAA